MRRCGVVGRARAQCRLVRQTARDFFVALAIFLGVFVFAALDADPARPAPAASFAAQLLHKVDDPYAPIVPAQVKPDTAYGRAAPNAGGTGGGEDASAMPSVRFATVGVMALLFAAMSALTLGLWRHLGRNVASTMRSRKVR